MAVTMDIGDPGDIHPKNKQEVGRRLALWAMSETYEVPEIFHTGPVYESMRVENGAALVKFVSQSRSGLGRQPADTGFVIAGDDHRFYPAEATLVESSVLRVSSAKVPKPSAVRYGWCAACEPNLGDGLPASPFRTDDWARNSVTFDDGGGTQYL